VLAVYTAAQPACAPPNQQEGSTAVPAEVRVDATQAKVLLLQRYRKLFGDKYLRDPAGGEYFAFPPLSEGQFQFVEEHGDAWHVRCEPPAGLAVEGRVAKNGSWVEILRVSYASE
jgi:hypothetical protein